MGALSELYCLRKRLSYGYIFLPTIGTDAEVRFTGLDRDEAFEHKLHQLIYFDSYTLFIARTPYPALVETFNCHIRGENVAHFSMYIEQIRKVRFPACIRARVGSNLQ